MITGRDLLGVKPKHPYRVWYINLEDPRDEIERRMAAIFKHYEIKPTDIDNHLFTDSGRDRNFIIEDRTPTHGYAETRGAAMAAFAKSWRRE
jgi:RecA-family ATPase